VVLSLLGSWAAPSDEEIANADGQP
jgi:hypothetical protein